MTTRLIYSTRCRYNYCHTVFAEFFISFQGKNKFSSEVDSLAVSFYILFGKNMTF